MSTLQQGAQHLGFIGVQSLGERHEGKTTVLGYDPIYLRSYGKRLAVTA